MATSPQIDDLLRLAEGVCRAVSFDPRTPTDLRSDDLIEAVVRSARLLLVAFGSPESAAEGLNEIFSELFSSSSNVEAALDRIEDNLATIEQKQDAAVLSRFRAGYQELRDGVRALNRDYGRQLVLSARSKLTELAELPAGLSYASVPSRTLAAASCILIGAIDTWAGELGAAQRYNLKAIVADPLWSEKHLPKSLLSSLAPEELARIESSRLRQVEIERTRVHDFFWTKAGIVALGIGGVALALGSRNASSQAGAVGARAEKAFREADGAEAQEAARREAIRKVESEAAAARSLHLRLAAKERLDAMHR